MWLHVKWFYPDFFIDHKCFCDQQTKTRKPHISTLNWFPQHMSTNKLFLCCWCLQGSCTTTLRLMTVLSTWLGSAICSPPSPCSWSRWLSAGRPGRNGLRPREQKAAVRPTAVSPPTACRTALCRNETQGRPSILNQHAHDLPWACIPWTLDSSLKSGPTWPLIPAGA